MYINKNKRLDALTLTCAIRQASITGRGMERCDEQLQAFTTLSHNEILHIKNRCIVATGNKDLMEIADLIEQHEI